MIVSWPARSLTPCYNRIRVASESASVSEPVPPEHPSDPAEQLYRELEAKIREYRPKDDLAPLEKAFRFASQCHEGQTRDSGEPYMVHPAHGGPHPGRHAHGPGRHGDRAAARRRRGHQRHRRAGPQGVRRGSGPLRGRRHQAEQARFLLRRGPPGRELPQDAAGHGRRHPRHHGEAGRPPAQHAHARVPQPGDAASASRARPSKSTRPSPTAWAWARSAANWKTWRSSTSSRKPTRRSSAPSNPRRHSNEEFLNEIRQTVESRTAPRRHSGARRRPREAALLRLPEAASARRSRSTRSTT